MLSMNARVTKFGLSILVVILLLAGFFSTISAESFIKNYSFEEDLDSWETNGSGAITIKEDDWAAPNGGEKRLDYYSDDSFQADTFQTITDLENGNYILSAYVANNDTAFNESYLYAEGNDGKVMIDIPRAGDWTLVELPVSVSGGEVTIGFYADGHAGAWLGIDVVSLVKEKNSTPEPEEFIKGVDISSLTKVEDHGGKFYDQGEEKDALEIFTDYGANYARLVIWKDPVDPLDPNYNNLEDTIRKAKRIKGAGMKLLLNFHYSDYWADPGRQDIPNAWKDYSFEELVSAVYYHTEETLTALAEEGIIPDMVQVGNEIRPGMLFPHGRIVNDDFSNLAELLNSGIQAVRDAEGGEHIDIMLHLDQGGDNEAYQWWFDGITHEGVTDYQVIGASYYPYWHGTLEDLEHNLNDISQRYDKNVVVVETSYGFILEDADGHGNIFNAGLEKEGGYPATVEGQAKFLYDLLEVIKNVPNNRGLGFFYWEPAWLGVKGAGWVANEGNAWENQAMFDFEGNALESLRIFTDGYVAPVPAPRPTDPEPEDPILRDLILHSRNKPTSASSSAGDGGGKVNAPENAVNGDDYTSWGTDEGIGAWWQVDLEEVLPIERILFDFWNGIEQIQIEVSEDGETYTDLGLFEIVDLKANLALPDGTTGRYIRVTITKSTSNWVGFMEFEAYGAEALVVQDQTAPVTEISINGELVDGSYIGQVTIRLIATDDESGVSKIEYSFDGGSTWDTYTEDINIEELGEHTILYRSVDFAGNIEEANRANFKIQAKQTDETPIKPTTPIEDEASLIDADQAQAEVESSLLPGTFTGSFNYLLGGILLIIVGAVVYFGKLRKRKIV